MVKLFLTNLPFISEMITLSIIAVFFMFKKVAAGLGYNLKLIKLVSAIPTVFSSSSSKAKNAGVFMPHVPLSEELNSK